MDVNLNGSLPKPEPQVQAEPPPVAAGLDKAKRVNSVLLGKEAVVAKGEKTGEDSTGESDVSNLPVVAQTVSDLLKSINSRLTINYRKDAGRYQVKIVEAFTSKVLKEIPPEEMINLVARIRKAIGAFLDTKV
ncbi:MAG: hypothetical protein GXP49_12440 [Deltaproteobacteria bacterium]|nr:hypothetical protein [Deltaproteobacteria bacterium]